MLETCLSFAKMCRKLVYALQNFGSENYSKHVITTKITASVPGWNEL